MGGGAGEGEVGGGGGGGWEVEGEQGGRHSKSTVCPLNRHGGGSHLCSRLLINVFTWVQNRFGGLLQFGLTFGHGDGNWSMFNPLLQWFSLNQFETSTPCNVQTKAGGGSEGDEEQDASSLHNRHRYCSDY